MNGLDQLLAGAAFAIAAALPLPFSAAPSPPQTDSLASERVAGRLGARLDSQLTRFAEYGFWGTVLVVREGRVVLLKGYGLADADRVIPNTAATRFELNSMTKMFTGVAILQLDAAGRLHVRDLVDRALGAFPAGKQGATIEQLASHTAGLIVEGSELSEGSRDAFVRDVKRTPRESPPGERYRYTNAGFSLLAAIIEVVSGESYEAYLQRHLFGPAGMTSALFRDQVPPHDPRYAHGYVGTPAGLEPGPPNPYGWGTRGAGGVWATVGDVYRWLVAVEQDSLLPEAQRRVLFSPATPPSLEAYGWHVQTTEQGRGVVQKGGGSDDFASHLLYYPHDHVVIIWANNNLRQRWRPTLNRTLPAIVFDDSVTLLPAPVAVPVADLQARAGRYRAGRNELRLRLASGYLFAESNGIGVPLDVMFFPQDGTHFTAFDPRSGSQFGLWFEPDAGTVTVALPDGRRVVARR